jgi:hypothetical protein
VKTKLAWFINVNKRYKCLNENKLTLSSMDYLITFVWVEQITNILKIHEIRVRKESIDLKIKMA